MIVSSTMNLNDLRDRKEFQAKDRRSTDNDEGVVGFFLCELVIFRCACIQSFVRNSFHHW